MPTNKRLRRSVCFDTFTASLLTRPFTQKGSGAKPSNIQPGLSGWDMEHYKLVGPQNVRNFSHPVRIRWIKLSNLATFIYTTGYLNVRKMSERLFFRTFIGALPIPIPILKKALNNTQYQYQYYERALTIPIPIAIFQKHPNITQYQYLTQ